MENFWTKFYDPATAAHIPALTDQSLIEFFDDRLTAFASREFTSNMERAINYNKWITLHALSAAGYKPNP